MHIAIRVEISWVNEIFVVVHVRQYPVYNMGRIYKQRQYNFQNIDHFIIDHFIFIFYTS